MVTVVVFEFSGNALPASKMGFISIEIFIENRHVRVKALTRKCPKACCVFL